MTGRWSALWRHTFGVVWTFWQHRGLLSRLVVRDLASRYRGSLGGLVWALLQPALMLLVYWFVFGHIFAPRGGGSADSLFALALFLGLILHGVLAETLSRAPMVIVAQPSYVKKIVFPLELLPVVVVCSAVVQSFLAGTLLLIVLGFGPGLPVTAWLWPMAWIPLVALSAGAALIVAALTVYLRDLAQLAGLLNTALLFLAPIFYPLKQLGERQQHWMLFNPLTVPIETARALLLEGTLPAMGPWLTHLAASLLLLMLGTWIFSRTRRGFADVI